MKTVFRAAHDLELAIRTQPAWCIDDAARALVTATAEARAQGHSVDDIAVTIIAAENAAMCVALGDAS